MNNEPSPDIKFKENISTMISLQPFIGLGLSAITALIVLLKGREWSFVLVFFTFFPFLICSILCFIEYITLKIITLIFIVLLIVLEILLFIMNSRSEIPKISLEQTENIIDSADDCYIIFGAQNCLYCNDMHDIYEDVFNEMNDVNMYYCDISYESYDNQILKKLEVDKLPMLLKFHKGKVVNQIVGKRDTKDIKQFVKER